MTHELLAALVETVDAGNRILYAVNTPKGTPIPKPIKIPRPHEQREEPKMSAVEDIRSFFGMRYVGKGD